jgi:hypothetical protein
MNIARFAALAALGISVSGCASIISGTTQQIAITTSPVSGASCELHSKEGTWTVTTPGVAKVDKTKEDISIHCAKDGYQDASATIPSSFEGWTFGNLILGGIVGVGVDAATGAMNKYPNAFNVPMTPAAPSAAPAAAPSTSPSS